MKTNSNLFVKLSRGLMLGIAITVTLSTALPATAGAVATDYRNGASGVGRAFEGDSNRQLALAVDRAVRSGGSPSYMRTAQFTAPRGAWAAYCVGYVNGKGWSGNWSYHADYSTAVSRAFDGMWRQNADINSVRLVHVWQE